MLNPVGTLSKYATQRGLSDTAYAAKETALLNALLHPLRTRVSEVDPFTMQPADVVAVYAHGGAATRVIRDDKGYEVQEWHFGEDDWRRLKGFPAAPSGHAAACEYGKEFSGTPLTIAQFGERWKSLNSVGDDAEPFESRQKMAEFFYDKQGIAWDDHGTNPWSHLTDVATVAMLYDGEVPSVYDAKERSRIQDTLRNLQLAWGEIEPVAKTVVDASPRYLVSVSSVTEPSPRLRPDAGYARTLGTKVDREWMTAEQMAATARQYSIDQASYPSPSYAEHVWWVSSKPTMEGVLETRFQLDVHELTDGEANFHEPSTEDFQRIANVIGVAFDEPMALPEARPVAEAYLIRGTYGTLAVNPDGVVLPAISEFDDDGEHSYRNIKRVDLDSYFRSRRGTEADLLNDIGEDDILEFGYWAISKDGTEAYAPAVNEPANHDVAL